MRSGFSRFLVAVMVALPLLAHGQRPAKNGGDFSNNTQFIPDAKIPPGVILVKGAWATSSDSAIPAPEGGSVSGNVFRNQYFGWTYALPDGWTQKYEGPPPSDSGRYVLAQLQPADTHQGSIPGSVLITAQDMFFTPLPAANAAELVNYTKDNLQEDYRVELAPSPTKIAGRPFIFFAYWSPVAQLHWYVLATEIRCHAVELVLSSRDTKLLESLVLGMNKMELPAEASPTAGTGGGAAPYCVKDYASDENVITRVDPVFPERSFNPVPVRIIIDKAGKVKYVHFLSAFPEQARVITDALKRWKFKPYLRNGQPAEVETGIMFGRAPHQAGQQGDAATE
ncbi:MAG: hypothetical protein WAL32_07090 [Terriglobales bacterium]